MEALVFVEYILRALGLILPVVFHGYRLCKELWHDHKRKSEPSVKATAVHLRDDMEIILVFIELQ